MLKERPCNRFLDLQMNPFVTKFLKNFFLLTLPEMSKTTLNRIVFSEQVYFLYFVICKKR